MKKFKKKGDEEQQTDAAPEPRATGAVGNDGGYGKSARDGLKQLIEGNRRTLGSSSPASDKGAVDHMKTPSGDQSAPPSKSAYDLDDDLDKDLNGDTLREECGVFGIFGHPEAAAITALGLHALQHRGQEAAGIVTYDNGRFHSERRLGLVGDTFSRAEVISRLPGNMAVGHVRYSTTGGTILRNVQPLFAELNAGGFAIAHNGNLTNGLTLRRELVRHGTVMQSTTDTEVILHLVAQSKRGRFIERYIEALRAIEGAYALVSLTNKKLVGARDPLGIRPLVLGELDGCPILTSETCALDIIGAKYVRDIEPGEVIVFDEHGKEIHAVPAAVTLPLHLRIHLLRAA